MATEKQEAARLKKQIAVQAKIDKWNKGERPKGPGEVWPGRGGAIWSTEPPEGELLRVCDACDGVLLNGEYGIHRRAKTWDSWGAKLQHQLGEVYHIRCAPWWRIGPTRPALPRRDEVAPWVRKRKPTLTAALGAGTQLELKVSLEEAAEILGVKP